MKRYLVICEETCPQCKGRSVPYDSKSSTRSSCAKCRGPGTIRKEVDLAEAMRQQQAFALYGSNTKPHILPDALKGRIAAERDLEKRPKGAPPIWHIVKNLKKLILTRTKYRC